MINIHLIMFIWHHTHTHTQIMWHHTQLMWHHTQFMWHYTHSSCDTTHTTDHVTLPHTVRVTLHTQIMWCYTQVMWLVQWQEVEIYSHSVGVAWLTWLVCHWDRSGRQRQTSVSAVAWLPGQTAYVCGHGQLWGCQMGLQKSYSHLSFGHQHNP